MKACTKCDIIKPFSEFYKVKNKRDGHMSRCRACIAEQDRSPQKFKDRISRQYHLTVEDYARMFNTQNGECAICHKRLDDTKYKGVNIDHCHRTGSVRGLLCGNCNNGIGYLKDSLDLVRAAAEYLERTATLPPRPPRPPRKSRAARSKEHSAKLSAALRTSWAKRKGGGQKSIVAPIWVDDPR